MAIGYTNRKPRLVMPGSGHGLERIKIKIKLICNVWIESVANLQTADSLCLIPLLFICVAYDGLFYEHVVILFTDFNIFLAIVHNNINNHTYIHEYK
jgi:hypothetical protein